MAIKSSVIHAQQLIIMLLIIIIIGIVICFAVADSHEIIPNKESWSPSYNIAADNNKQQRKVIALRGATEDCIESYWHLQHRSPVNKPPPQMEGCIEEAFDKFKGQILELM
ncbi:hypothetical protein PIB30_086997 [Stylosanthes scabra]|uniref:Uncharacterized protein n=1 Tax=Stylosanthes scabra TaxID=79078 RepID=A0ABU6TUP9_9FABA|nr:hypothetical protein [Stylosanthes scabra]